SLAKRPNSTQEPAHCATAGLGSVVIVSPRCASNLCTATPSTARVGPRCRLGRRNGGSRAVPRARRWRPGRRPADYWADSEDAYDWWRGKSPLKATARAELRAGAGVVVADRFFEDERPDFERNAEEVLPGVHLLLTHAAQVVRLARPAPAKATRKQR